jgi:hypothetical protein
MSEFSLWYPVGSCLPFGTAQGKTIPESRREVMKLLRAYSYILNTSKLKERILIKKKNLLLKRRDFSSG